MPVPEQEVAQIWAEVLGIRHVDPHTNFFDLGGHSLLLAELVDQLNGKLGIETDVLAVLEHPTVAIFSAHCEPASQGES